MVPIDRVGVYRGRCVEHAVNTTKNGFPQFVGRFEAAELFNAETGTWEPWAQYEMDMTAYLVLHTDKGPMLNAEQVRQAFGWDGGSLAELCELEIKNVMCQFRVEEDDYSGSIKLKITWIDNVDANPQRGIKRLDATALKDLDAKFGLGKKVAPAKAPVRPPTKAAAPAKPAVDPTTASAAPAAPAEAAPAAAPSTAGKPPAPPKGKKPAAPAAPAAAPAAPEVMTKEEAWASVSTLKRDDVDDSQMLAAWMGSCCRIQGINTADGDLETSFNDVDEDKMTPEQWFRVRNATLAEIPHYPF